MEANEAAERIPFWATWRRSMFDVGWYRDVRMAPASKGVRYWLVACLVLAAFQSVVFAGHTRDILTSAVSFLHDHVPAAMTYTMKAGTLHTDPATLNADVSGFKVVMDTSKTADAIPRDFDDGLAVGSDSAILRGGGEDAGPILYKFAPDASGTGASLLTSAQQIQNTLPLALIPIMYLPIWLLSFGYGLLYSLSSASLLVLVQRMWRVNLSFWQWFTMGLYASTLPSIIDTSFGALGHAIPFVFSGLFILYCVAIMTDERANPTGRRPAKPPKEEKMSEDKTGAA